MSAPTDLAVLEHIAYSVFLPPKLPQAEQDISFQLSVDLAIIRSVIQAGQEYSTRSGENIQWNSLVIYVRAQNTAIIVRKQTDHTIYEAFEVQAQVEDVMSTPSKFSRHFPGPVVRVPNSVANENDFIEEVAKILAKMNTTVLEKAKPKPRPNAGTHSEKYDSINPNYFIQYFLGFLRGLGSVIDPPRIVKRLADEVLLMNSGKPWRRSPLWLITRIVLQTSLASTIHYKFFMTYYHASVVSRCRQHDTFNSDFLYAMRVKMIRRLYKLKEPAPRFLIDNIKEVAEDTEVLLQERWREVQSIQAQGPNQNFSDCDFESALNQTLPNARSYLNQVFQRRSIPNSSPGFAPAHSPRLEKILEFTQYSGKALSEAFSKDPHLALYDFEDSVFDNIGFWTSRRRGYPGACATIASCFHQYFAAARPYYEVDIADKSIMVLTLMRLWMAIDELTTYECPLLLEFSPEIPNDTLDKLMLRTAQHIDQARTIQRYISERRAKASPSSPSIFSDNATDSSFAVKYFRSSHLHQRIKLDIEKKAQEQKDRKLQELYELNARYEQLAGEAQDMAHQYYDITDQTAQGGGSNQQRQHSHFCERCTKDKERRGVQIQICEWPLPPSQPAAETVVFELHRPESFTIWRDITYAVLVDLGIADRNHWNQSATLEQYNALAPWLSTPTGITPRIVIASSTSFSQVLRHNKAINIPALADQVCLSNPLHFKLYDKNRGVGASAPFSLLKFAKYGKMKIPKNSAYRHLKYSLKGTTHTSNEVLANQHDCPEELSLHEHIAFGTLRSGACLQWMNILRGLEEDLLTFSSDEVQLLHTQAAWQIGPLSLDGSRDWHKDLSYREFGRSLISQCTRVLHRVKENYLQANSVMIIITLVNRLLAASPLNDVVQEACDFLRKARNITHQWLGQLEAKLLVAAQEEIVEYQYRICEVATLCRLAYDVGPQHLGILLSAPEDYTTLVESLIALCNNQPPDPRNAPLRLQVCLRRDRRFAQKIAPYLLASINSQIGDIFSKSLRKIWPSHQLGSTGWWRTLEASNNRWITTTIAGVNNIRTQEVHFNLLDGQLLVDGEPLGRLPTKYTQNATYVRLFGQKIIDVVPANAPGMKFTTRSPINNYQVSFALDGRNELIIQAQNGERIYELIPHKILSHDLPYFFFEDYHHWADVENKTIEFRPISSPWSANECQWLLCFEGFPATLKNLVDDSCLLDIHSATFKSLSRSICPLESSQFLHATRSGTGSIDVILPRMKLSFFVNADMQLESHNFGGLVIDENQSAGTLFGLKNQLLIRAKATVDEPFPRSRAILVPDGKVEFNLYRHHVSVSIGLGQGRDVDVYRYKVDDDLKCLATDAGLTSRLFKIYLHGLTSHCIPDPLTGRTGTEEALYELSRASTWSFAQINRKQVELLEAIGKLTPTRDYMSNLKFLQRTHWTQINPLSQHVAFASATTAVLLRADMLQLFHPLKFNLHHYISALKSTDNFEKRAAQRNAMYYPADIIGNISQIIRPEGISDRMCPGRDSLAGDYEQAGQAASWATLLAYQRWEQRIFSPFDLVTLAESWKTLDDFGEHTTLFYSISWFDLKLESCWISFYDLLRQAKTSSNKYMLSTCLAAVAFGQTSFIKLIPVFLAFTTNQEFQSLNPPSQRRFKLQDGYEPTQERVEEFVAQAAHPIQSSPSGDLVQNMNESERDFHCRREDHYRTHLSNFQTHLVGDLLSQWPSTDHQTNIQLRCPNSDLSRWLNIESCLKLVSGYFSNCRLNITMRDHLRQLQAVLASHPISTGIDFAPAGQAQAQIPIATHVYTGPWESFRFNSLMCSRTAPELADASLLSNFLVSRRTGRATDTSRLTSLLAEFRGSPSALNRRYGTDLDKSRRELEGRRSLSLPQEIPSTTRAMITQTREQCLNYLLSAFQQLESALSPQNEIERIVYLAGIWPRITPRNLFDRLSIKNRPDIGFDWHNELIVYAQGFVDYQRSQRLILLAKSGDTEEFYKELADFATTSDESLAVDDPDWILVQIDGNFGIRSLQRRVAQEMISPSSESNIVLQLNMGEGLANRRIYYLPFGRHINADGSTLQQLRRLYEECMKERGILLAQPEHILSFKLTGIDRLVSPQPSSSSNTAADAFMKTQLWLKSHTRDILDESDEILHARYRLVYTIGEERLLEDHPDRWTTTQQLLCLAVTHMEGLYREHPQDVLYQPNNCGQFPILRIMPDCEAAIEKKLKTAIATDILNGKLLNLSCGRLPPSVRNNLLDFFIRDGLQYSQYESVRRSCSPTLWKGLLLVRGLLASGILIFALKHKHYRVDYGLDLSRSLLAVPYRAKDMPSMRAEFGHPDITVVLTCLSYYYHGLTEEHLDLCFKLIFRLDNPSLEYQQWVKQNNSIPDTLKQLNSVNTKDRQQFTEQLMPIFSHNPATINFFLSSVVFPKDAKEFPDKLTTSGWDLAEEKCQVTTGFSGTNDNRYLLPTSITQVDPVRQLSTNALVLTYLIQPENNSYLCMRNRNGGNLSTEEFLQLLVAQTREIRVLLDVGAQMLELQNEELVRCWLRLRADVDAAVYFNNRDELVVLSRAGKPVLLNTSPYAQKLNECLVYLDDGHTRGTDLKLPRGTRAMVTLGPKVTKDRLLQGCMRMRKLGHGQSVMFAAPPEVDTQIRNSAPNRIDPEAPIDALDVLRWAMLNTCNDLKRHVPQWAQQGIEFNQRLEAEERYEQDLDVPSLRRGWTTRESRKLEELYGVPSPEELHTMGNFTQRARDLPGLRERLNDLGIQDLGEPRMDEEQEREVDHEIQQERYNPRPPKRQPANHSVHPNIEQFVRTGTLPTDRSGIVTLFHPFKASNPEIAESCSRLLFASCDFLQTITGLPIDQLSDYMRPVNWVVSGAGHLQVVLSPYEVDKLLPLLRSSCVARLHIYAPRLSLSMLSFSEPRFYSIPAPPANQISSETPSTAQLQLDLFAGQLYFSDYQKYASLCATLGLFVPTGGENESTQAIEIESDGFIKPAHRARLIHLRPEYSDCRLTETPIPALKDLVERRRKGMKYLLTHVEQITHSRTLTPGDFEPRQPDM
ncbi:Polycystin-1 [Rhizoctonia solani]|uniref:ubiquitinyl hydrolase 1 n=1 Tax=Rhizoctonia solani TaxID=456999 RepID=A0A0K6FZW8_9AGAM|nr:Polycystin-1 [Rhizoctonia solani]